MTVSPVACLSQTTNCSTEKLFPRVNNIIEHC